MEQKVLTGHISKETAYLVESYPYGRKRTQKYYWIESKKTFGDRLATVTINPKTGKLNKPHYSTYYPFAYLHLDQIGHVQLGVFGFNSAVYMNEAFSFILKSIGENNLLDLQKEHLRSTLTGCFIADSYYENQKVPTQIKEAHSNWAKETVEYMMNCPFAEILSYPPAPTVGEKEPQPEEFVC